MRLLIDIPMLEPGRKGTQCALDSGKDINRPPLGVERECTYRIMFPNSYSIFPGNNALDRLSQCGTMMAARGVVA